MRRSCWRRGRWRDSSRLWLFAFCSPLFVLGFWLSPLERGDAPLFLLGSSLCVLLKIYFALMGLVAAIFAGNSKLLSRQDLRGLKFCRNSGPLERGREIRPSFTVACGQLRVDRASKACIVKSVEGISLLVNKSLAADCKLFVSVSMDLEPEFGGGLSDGFDGCCMFTNM